MRAKNPALPSRGPRTFAFVPFIDSLLLSCSDGPWTLRAFLRGNIIRPTARYVADGPTAPTIQSGYDSPSQTGANSKPYSSAQTSTRMEEQVACRQHSTETISG